MVRRQRHVAGGPFGGTFCDDGASRVNSFAPQGRPLIAWGGSPWNTDLSEPPPRGGGRLDGTATIALPGLAGWECTARAGPQGLSPLAIDGRPYGAKRGRIDRSAIVR